MRILVYEYLCATATTDLPPSLTSEGQAMIAAFVADVARIPDVEVHTLWCESLGVPPFPQNVRVHYLPSGMPLSRDFVQQYSQKCDTAFVIAPECDGILAEHCQWISETSCRWLGPTSAAILLCTDKLALARHLAMNRIATIPTESWIDGKGLPGGMTFPVVIKPRDGAGSQATYLLQSPDHYQELESILNSESMLSGSNRPRGIVQPFIAGQAVSVAVMLDATGDAIPFPVCEQRLSRDGRFHYEGGRLPARLSDGRLVQELAVTACRSVNGLRGYVGVDLIVPDEGDRTPLVVEINPRLTTSYRGYRALTVDNLAEWIVNSRNHSPQWVDREIAFEASGTIERRKTL